MSCDHHHGHNKDISKLLIAFGITFVFMVVEVIGGVISGSLALLADAAHMSTDAFALALAASAHWMSRRPPDKSLHFGYRRFQVLAAFVNSLLLVILIGWILIEAVQRYIDPRPVVWSTMLGIAILGLLANGLAFAVLTYGDKDNVNIRGAVLHVASDMLGSLAAIIAALVIMATGWLRVDPILSIFVACLIGRSAIRLLRETGHILLEGAPGDIDVVDLKNALSNLAPEIDDIHNIQIWQITPEHPRLTMHVAVTRAEFADATLAKIKSFLEEHYQSIQSTIQVELKNQCPDMIYSKLAGTEYSGVDHFHSDVSTNNNPQSSVDSEELTTPGISSRPTLH